MICRYFPPSGVGNVTPGTGASGEAAVTSLTKGSAMPYLQLDAPHHYAVDVKRALARRLGESYARIMQTTPELVTVAFRELGEGGVWCCGAGEPEPAALLSCDIRRGRPPEQRAELARALIDACVETLGLRSDR